MGAELVTLNLGALAIVMGAAWKLSRDITTLQVHVQLLTDGLKALEKEIQLLHNPE